LEIVGRPTDITSLLATKETLVSSGNTYREDTETEVAFSF
jgi:hypothetical protein